MSLRSKIEKRWTRRRPPPVPANTPSLFGGELAVETKANPCAGCPLQRKKRVVSVLPQELLAIVLGLAPGPNEVKEGTPFVGPAGELLRKALTAGGFDVDTQIGFANITDCRPDEEGDWKSKQWTSAAKRCDAYRVRELMAHPKVPLLVLGGEAVRRYMNGYRGITAHRGMWWSSSTEPSRPMFVTWHPASIIRSKTRRKALAAQFVSDIARFSDRVLGREQPIDVKYQVISNPFTSESRRFFQYMATRKAPWAFDIETFDGESPQRSREGVPLDAYGPDFRVHGIGFGLGPKKGVYLLLKGWEHKRDKLRGLLDPVFMSNAEKIAHHGNFDEEGLVAQQWITGVRNRTRDTMLGMIALDDGLRAQNTLSRGIVEILGEPPHWEIDKMTIGAAKLSDVADGCVRDACATYRLDERIQAAFREGKRI